MRIAILTTDTAHHRYFLRRLHRERPAGAEIVLNLFEEKTYPWENRARRHLRKSLPNLWRGVVLNPYLRSKSQARRAARFESAHFFPDGDDAVPDAFPTHRVHSVNDDEAGRLLDQAGPDVLLVYGTGKIEPHVFDRRPMGALNAHGGLLPGYRGLDTNLWAAIEGRPDDMAVTIHRVDAELDTGAVCLRQRLGPIPGLDLASLRYHTTRVCTDLFLEAVALLIEGRLPFVEQTEAGRYFGPMPVLLKRRAERIIRDYASRKPADAPGLAEKGA